MKVTVVTDSKDTDYVFVVVTNAISSIDFIAKVDAWVTIINNDRNEVLIHNGWRLRQQTFTLMQLKWNLEIIEG